MFQANTNYTKLKTNLRLAINRLKLIEKKKSELATKSRKEIADFLAEGKYERAKIRVEHIIREDYMVEAMEILEMYCDLLLSRFGMLQEYKTLDPSLAESVSSILWAAPRLANEINELKMISDQLTIKLGKKYTESCRAEQENTISEKLRHKMGVQAPPKILVEKYLIEIAKIYNISYEPDPQVMKEYEQEKGLESLLFDSGPIPNDLGPARPPGFIGYPQAPLVPAVPFNYPPPNPELPMDLPSVPGPGFSYNIPPGGSDPAKPINTFNAFAATPPPVVKPPQTTPDSNQQSNEQPKPMPRSKMSPPDVTLPDLPSVPSDNLDTHDSDDGGFEDLAKRFEELKKIK